MSASVLSKIGFDLPTQLSSSLYREEYVIIQPQNPPNSGQSYTGDIDVIFDITSASDVLLDASYSSLCFQGRVETTYNNTTQWAANQAPSVEALPMFCSGVPITRTSSSVNGGTIKVGSIDTNFSRYLTARLLCADEPLLPCDTFKMGSSRQPTATSTLVGTAPAAITGVTTTLDEDKDQRSLCYTAKSLSLNKFCGCNLVSWPFRTQSIYASMVDVRNGNDRKTYAPRTCGLNYEVPLSALCPLFDTLQYVPVSLLAQSTGSSGIRVAFRFASADKVTNGPCAYTMAAVSPADTTYGNSVISKVECKYSNVRMILKFVRILDPALMATIQSMYNQSPSILPDGQIVQPMGRLTLNYKDCVTFEHQLLAGANVADLTFNISHKSILGMLHRFRNVADSTKSGVIEKNLADIVPAISSYFVELGNDSTIPLTAINSETVSPVPSVAGAVTDNQPTWQCNSVFSAMYRAGRHIFALDPIHSQNGEGAMSRIFSLYQNNCAVGDCVWNNQMPNVNALSGLGDPYLPFMILTSFENFSSKEVDLSSPESHVRGLNTWTKNGVIKARFTFSTPVVSDTIIETMFITNEILLIARGAIAKVSQELLS